MQSLVAMSPFVLLAMGKSGGDRFAPPPLGARDNASKVIFFLKIGACCSFSFRRDMFQFYARVKNDDQVSLGVFFFGGGVHAAYFFNWPTRNLMTNPIRL